MGSIVYFQRRSDPVARDLPCRIRFEMPCPGHEVFPPFHLDMVPFIGRSRIQPMFVVPADTAYIVNGAKVATGLNRMTFRNDPYGNRAENAGSQEAND